MVQPLWVISRLSCCGNCLGHCPPLPADCNRAGRFYSPLSFSSSPSRSWVFFHSLPSRIIFLQPLIWVSSVSPTSLLLPFPTLSPVPPALSPHWLPFSSFHSHCTQQRQTMSPCWSSWMACNSSPAGPRSHTSATRLVLTVLACFQVLNQQGGRSKLLLAQQLPMRWHTQFPHLPCRGCEDHVSQLCPVFDLIMQFAQYKGFFKAT